MKKAVLFTAILLSGFTAQQAAAQVHVSINISSQPTWGPVGYDYVQYYYMPDIDAYYYVPKHQYIFQQNGRWIFATSLPSRFHDYDVYHSYKVVINEPKPYLHNSGYRTKYGSYKGHHDQEVIRDSHDSKYFEIKDHPEHNKWKNDHKGGSDHHRHN